MIVELHSPIVTDSPTNYDPEHEYVLSTVLTILTVVNKINDSIVRHLLSYSVDAVLHTEARYNSCNTTLKPRPIDNHDRRYCNHIQTLI